MVPTHSEQDVCLYLWFKVIDGPPEIERPYDFLNDLNMALGYRASHVELQMPNNHVYTATSRNMSVVKKSNYDHAIQTNESYWFGYKITVTDKEHRQVLEFLERRVGWEYSWFELMKSYFTRLQSYRSERDMTTYTCTSICYHALHQSEFFRHLLLHCSDHYANSAPGDCSVFVRLPQHLAEIMQKMVEYCDTQEGGRLKGRVTNYSYPRDRYKQREMETKMSETRRRYIIEHDSYSSSSDDDGVSDDY